MSILNRIYDLGKGVILAGAALSPILIPPLSKAENLGQYNNNIVVRSPSLREYVLKEYKKAFDTEYMAAVSAGEASSVPRTIYIDSGWTRDEINELMDNDGVGVNGEEEPAFGDTVWLAEPYRLPNTTPQIPIEIYTPGVAFRGEDRTITFLKGPLDATSAIVLRVYAPHVTVSDMEIGEAWLGVDHKGDYGFNLVERVDFATTLAGVLHNKTLAGDNSLPSVTYDEIFAQNPRIGVFFDEEGMPSSEQSPFPYVARSTFRQVTEIGVHPPFYIPGQTGNFKTAFSACPTIAGQYDENLFVDSPDGSSFFPPSVSCGSNGFKSFNLVDESQFPITLSGEFNVGTNVGWETLADRGIGVGNIDDSDGFNYVTVHGRPVIGSISIGPQFSSGKIGAFNPAGDANGDNQLNLVDLVRMGFAMNNPNPSLKEVRTFDFDGDFDIDWDDLNNPDPNVPSFLDGYLDSNFDCQPNGVPDLQEYNISLDINGNLILDECEISSPVNPVGVKKNRYLTFTSGTLASGLEDAVLLAIRVRTDGLEKWVGEPSVDGISRLVNQPVYRNWSLSEVNVGDCGIVPVRSYLVDSITEGFDINLEGNYSGVVVVSTIDKPEGKFWADVVGNFDGTNWNGPDGLVNVNDVLAWVKHKTVGNPSDKTLVDLDGEVPNGIVNATDLQRILQGFSGKPYPFSSPENCP